MANPTLLAQSTPWRGFTFNELKEMLLNSRELTTDTTTERTVATTAEAADAEKALFRAFDLFAAEFISLWSRRSYSTTWTSGDHSIALPANVTAVVAVVFDGRPVEPMTPDTYYRLLRDVDSGGDIDANGRPTRYRITGYANVGGAEDPVDWRTVLRLHPVPSTDLAGKTFDADYFALAEAYATKTDAVALLPFCQGWVLERAKELWAAQLTDAAMQSTAEKERAKHERTIDEWLKGTREPVSAMTWRYPSGVRARRYRR